MDEACSRVKGVLESWGFKLQDETLAEDRCTSLGVFIDGESGVVSLPPAKLARLVAACEFMSHRPVVTSRQVQRILGHITYACMLFRPLLAVTSSAYAFTRKGRPEAEKLWPSVAKEFWHLRCLLPLCVGHMKTTTRGEVFAADASDVGFAVCSAKVPQSLVDEAARWSERGRFKFPQEAQQRSFRSRALGSEEWVEIKKKGS